MLYEWQKILEVPIVELLVESEDVLSKPLLQRAQLVRLMKTALAILEQADSKATRGDGPDPCRSVDRSHA